MDRRADGYRDVAVVDGKLAAIKRQDVEQTMAILATIKQILVE